MLGSRCDDGNCGGHHSTVQPKRVGVFHQSSARDAVFRANPYPNDPVEVGLARADVKCACGRDRLNYGFVVRPDYVHEVAGQCQRFAGAVCIAEPGVFQSAVHALTAQLPQAETSANLLFTWALLGSVIMRAALTYHAQFHRCFGGACEFQPHSTPPLDTSEWTVMRQHIDKWAEAYAATFDRAHRWPAAIAAAAALRRQPLKVWYAPDLAKAVGASCSTLERGFRAIYGTPRGDYHTLLRLRHSVEALRGDNGSLESIALECGWTSANAFARAFRSRTGMTPSVVRLMPDEAFAALANEQLALPLPAPPSRPVARARRESS